MSTPYKSIEAKYTRSHELGLKNVGVICPNCGIGHRFGDIKLNARYIMPPETYFDHKANLIMPKFSAALPIDPKTYNLMSFMTVVKCYECKSKMLMAPYHLIDPMEAFNSWKLFTNGVYFTDDQDPRKRYVKRRLYFSDVNFLLVALMDRVEFENIELNPLTDKGTCSRGVYKVWEFDVSPTKDQDFEMLKDIQIVRDDNGHTGYVGYSPEYEEGLYPDRDTDATKVFMNALSVILDFVIDVCEHDDYDTAQCTTDPFREFYREEYKMLRESKITQADSFRWETSGENEVFPYPSMSVSE